MPKGVKLVWFCRQRFLQAYSKIYSSRRGYAAKATGAEAERPRVKIGAPFIFAAFLRYSQRSVKRALFYSVETKATPKKENENRRLFLQLLVVYSFDCSAPSLFH